MYITITFTTHVTHMYMYTVLRAQVWGKENADESQTENSMGMGIWGNEVVSHYITE
jgi:hypothetical protein